MKLRRCSKCKRRKPLRCFTKDFSYCRLCHRKYKRQQYAEDSTRKIAQQKAWYRSNRKAVLSAMKRMRARRVLQLLQYLRCHPCVDCGEQDPIVLDFDHVRGRKRFSISWAMTSVRWSLVLQEIKKCDVRCANCHRRKTARERRSLRYVLRVVDEKETR